MADLSRWAKKMNWSRLLFLASVVIAAPLILASEPKVDGTAIPAKAPVQAKNPIKVIDRLLASGKPVTFVSRSGKFYGMDSDTELEFEAGGKVRLTEFGYSVQEFLGTFAADEDGVISVQLKNRRSPWPAMVLQFSKGDYYLSTNTGAVGFVFGDRAASTETPEMKAFWPFRLVDTHRPEPNQAVEPTPPSRGGSP
ncbi:MAG: hypothetical protein PSV13_15325 [Lacunisphaera sp.]|nr:hypothetical protein [Lacunisphaera sp.]